MPFKTQVVKKCKDLLQERLERIDLELAQKRESLANETKSSAGDKYETSRAMLHLEMDKLQSQRLECLRLQTKFKSLSKEPAVEINEGALVMANNQWYYLGLGLGKIEVGDLAVFCLSASSPLGAAFLKSDGKQFEFREAQFKISAIN